jgi:diguanylate cyclase (GGDEF)-like protein/PAS domain S-box-containing protein
MSAAYFVRGDVSSLPATVFTTNTLALLIAVTAAFLALGALALAAVSRNREMTEQLRSSEERWKLAIEGSGDGVWDWNPQTDQALFSKRWQEMLGYAENEFPATGTAWVEHLHPDDRERVLATIQAYFATSEHASYAVEFRMRCKDGAWKWILARGVLVGRDTAGAPLRMIGTHTDITPTKRVEAELRIAATAFESQEGMMVTDASNHILRVNQSFTRITGYTPEEVIGKDPKLLSSGNHDSEFFHELWRTLHESDYWEGEIWNRRKNGELFPEHLTITAVRGEGGAVTHYVGTLTDITVSKAAADEIKNLAFYDPLTRLPNRRLLIDRLQQATVASTRSGHIGALLFIDLDNFKTLNDTLGHIMGDLLLKLVGERLSACVREGDTVARLGGDEFVVMLEDLSKNELEAAEQTEQVGEKILAALNRPYRLIEHEYRSTPSIGAALFHGQQKSIDELMKQADIAMYQAKKAGRNAFSFFDPEMQEAINARLDIESDLHQSIGLGQLHLYYQIQVSDSNQPLGAEALIRWIHPVRGFVSPAQFIPLAEETGLILPVGLWVLETACAQLGRWQQNQCTRQLSLSINVSAKQFHQSDFVSHVRDAVARNAINPGLLKLELTESMLLENIEDIIDKMTALKEIGVRFSLDDFGTGYSSLQYLKRLPLDQLKIDQSFVRDITLDSSDRAIVRTIIAMAQSLNLSVIAEGVETEPQRQLLLHQGCTSFQGYLFGKPLPISEFEARLGISR